MNVNYISLKSAAKQINLEEWELLFWGAKGELPIYIDGNGCTIVLGSCGLHSFHHLQFVRARYKGFIRIAPSWIETIRKNGAAHLAGTTSCFIPGDAKQPLEYLRDYSHPQAGKIPESDLDLILSDQPIFVTPHCTGPGFYYAGRTDRPHELNRVEHDIFVSTADLMRLKKQPEQGVEKILLKVARARLENRPGAYDHFRTELLASHLPANAALLSATFQARWMTPEFLRAGGRSRDAELAELRIAADIIDDWARNWDKHEKRKLELLAPPAAETDNNRKPAGKRRTEQIDHAITEARRQEDNPQIADILSALSDLDFDKDAVPRGGKKKAKAYCIERNKLTNSTFDAAWKKASKAGLIRHELKEKCQSRS